MAASQPEFSEALKDLISHYNSFETYWYLRDYFITEARKRQADNAKNKAEDMRRFDITGILCDIVRLVATPEELAATEKITAQYACKFLEQRFDVAARDLLFNSIPINQRVIAFIREVTDMHTQIYDRLRGK